MKTNIIYMNAQKKALEYLSKNYLLHADMIHCIQTGSAKKIKVAKNGVLMYSSACHSCLLTAENQETADFLIGKIEKADCVVCHQEFYIEALKHKFGLDKEVPCYQAVYTKPQPLAMPQSEMEIKTLEQSHADFVIKHYSRMRDESYIIERIEAKEMFGAFIGETQIGFLGLHDEGSMGFLEILPKYRRKGLAVVLESFLINYQLSRKQIPFAHIITDNQASLNLQKKMGLEIADGTVTWTYKS